MQEQEVNSEQRVQNHKKEHEATKMKPSNFQIISHKTLELCEQCKNYVKEIEHLNGVSEFAIYHAVERNGRSGGLDGWVP